MLAWDALFCLLVGSMTIRLMCLSRWVPINFKIMIIVQLIIFIPMHLNSRSTVVVVVQGPSTSMGLNFKINSKSHPLVTRHCQLLGLVTLNHFKSCTISYLFLLLTPSLHGMWYLYMFERCDASCRYNLCAISSHSSWLSCTRNRVTTFLVTWIRDHINDSCQNLEPAVCVIFQKGPIIMNLAEK